VYLHRHSLGRRTIRSTATRPRRIAREATPFPHPSLCRKAVTFSQALGASEEWLEASGCWTGPATAEAARVHRFTIS